MRTAPLPALFGILACLALARPASADVLIAVDKASQRMDVSVDGQPLYSWPVSTGVASYDTPSGAYRPFRMERTHFSREWDDAPMPFAVFFTGQGHAIHATNQVRALGRPASHGCVRLSVRNAATLFDLVKSQGMSRTRVRIEGEGVRVADHGGSAYRTARGRDAYDIDDAMTAPVRVVRRPLPASYRPARRPDYGPAAGYGTYDPADFYGGRDW